MGESVALYSFRPDLPIGHIILPILNMFYQMNNFLAQCITFLRKQIRNIAQLGHFFFLLQNL